MTNIQMLIVQVMMAVDEAKDAEGRVDFSFIIVEQEGAAMLTIVPDGFKKNSSVVTVQRFVPRSLARVEALDLLKALKEIGNAQIREVNARAIERKWS